MRLIDADKLKECDFGEYGYEMRYEIDRQPTVLAIPLDKVEQIKEEIGHAMDMEPAWKGQDNYVGGLEIALSIIDKKLKEQRNDSR